MTDKTENTTPDSITTEACAWLAQLETGDMSQADMDAFFEWINRSPRHAAEIKIAAAWSEEFNALLDLGEPLIGECGKVGATKSGQRSGSIIGFVKAQVFGLVMLACAIIIMLLADPFQSTPDRQFFTTGVGETRTVSLTDGTVMTLNTDSVAEVRYSRKLREVRLAKGEAFFDVAHNKSRPFEVYAGDHYARAVGTAFAVRLLNNETKLIVTEGAVEFSELTASGTSAAEPRELDVSSSVGSVSANPAAPILVKAGQVAVSTSNTAITQVIDLSDNERRSNLSWTEGLFDFSETPLSEVVREVSRYTTTKITIEDQKLENVEFGGVFRIDDINRLLDALPSVGVIVVHVSEKEVILRSADST